MTAPLPADVLNLRIDQMVTKLRENDFRLTPQRLAIVRIMAASEGHPSVEMVYEKVRANFPTTSIATVYKTIKLLKDVDEVLELGFPDGSNRYDGARPYPHPHVVCTGCGRIEDPDLDSLDHMTKEVAAETNFKIQHHRVDFFGLCTTCLAEKA